MGKLLVIPEIWKNVNFEGFENRYQVSTYGRVRSLDTFGLYLRKGRVLKKQLNKKDGRWYVCLKNGNWRKGVKPKNVKVARLVALTFIPNPNNLPEVNHKDENPSNDIVTNLEWCSRVYNQNYGTCIQRMASKLKKPVCQLTKDGEVIKIWDGACTAEKYFRGDKTKCGCIANCCSGRHKTSFGYKWKYLEDM